MSDRMKMPIECDYGFYQRRKHDKWRAVAPPEPSLEAPVADSHAHIHMLPEPSWELVRCAANGVRFVCEICDPSEDELDVPGDMRRWIKESSGDAPGPVPELRITAGVHPHNAKLYDEAVEARLRAWLAAPETVVLGEIGLDYHYDLSPRDVQKNVFRRQIRLAKELDMPIALHLRGGEDEASANGSEAAARADATASDQPARSNAHAEAFEILSEEGFPPRGTILHCCSLPPEELLPWIEADCYIAYGGVLTFKKSEAAREGARIVPEDRLLLETDSPYMAPEPMRGVACTPAHVIFTAECLAALRGHEPGGRRERFLQRVYENTLRFFGA